MVIWMVVSPPQPTSIVPNRTAITQADVSLREAIV
jgi:hypothetical protein